MAILPTVSTVEHQLVFLVSTTLNEGCAGAMHERIPVHLQFLDRLHVEGLLLFGGPLVDSEMHNSGNGMYVLRAETLADAQALAAQDPLHHEGIRTANITHWMLRTNFRT